MAHGSAVFLHVDLDEFFVQVERLSAPHLRGRPLLVGGLPGGRGEVACPSREARIRGVRAGIAISRALRLCPEAIVVPCRPDRIHDMSRRFLFLLLERTPRVEPRSLDEALLDVRDLVGSLEEGIALGRSIQEELTRRLGLAASIGVAPARGIARIACEEAKPAGCVAWDAGSFHARLGDAPISGLPGVGAILSRRLARVGIRTFGDLRAAPDEKIIRALGRRGLSLRAVARGEDRDPVVPFDRFGVGRTRERRFTFPRPLERKVHLRRVVVGIGEEIARGLRSDRAHAALITLTLVAESGETRRGRAAFEPPAAGSERILGALERCLDALDPLQPIRALTIRVQLTRIEATPEPDLFSEKEESAWDEAADRVLERFGRGSLVRAVFLSRGKGTG